MTELVTVATFMNVNLAQLARLRLDMAGIPSFLIDAETVAMDWALGRAIGQIKLQVASGDEGAALRALERSDAEAADPGDQESDPSREAGS